MSRADRATGRGKIFFDKELPESLKKLPSYWQSYFALYYLSSFFIFYLLFAFFQLVFQPLISMQTSFLIGAWKLNGFDN